MTSYLSQEGMEAHGQVIQIATLVGMDANQLWDLEIADLINTMHLAMSPKYVMSLTPAQWNGLHVSMGVLMDEIY